MAGTKIEILKPITIGSTTYWGGEKIEVSAGEAQDLCAKSFAKPSKTIDFVPSTAEEVREVFAERGKIAADAAAKAQAEAKKAAKA